MGLPFVTRAPAADLIAKEPGLADQLSDDPASMTPVDVEWLDGSSTELTVTTELQGDGCLRASFPSGLPMEHASGSVTYPALFKVQSADGRVKGEYPGTLVSFPEGDGHGVTSSAPGWPRARWGRRRSAERTR